MMDAYETKGWEYQERKNQELAAAFESGSYSLAESLIEDGADIHATDKEGRTPISNAIRNGHWVCVTNFRNYLQRNMIQYDFPHEETSHLFDQATNSKIVTKVPVGIFRPLIYSYSVEVTLRSGKKITANISSIQTFKELITHLQWMSETHKESFYTGKDFAFKPKEVALITLC